MDNTQFRKVSVGIVAEDKNKGSKFISIQLIEALPFYEGNVTTNVVNVERGGKDASGKEYSHVLQRCSVIKAEWRGRGNRLTSPNVRKGETVNVYQLGNTERYFWDETGRENHLRRSESVTYAFNASKTDVKEGEAPTSNKHYSVSVDGEEGHITIKTSKANDEKAAYTIQINGRGGQVTIADDTGNIFQLDSVKNSITCKNKDKSYIVLSGEQIILGSEKTVTIKAPDIILDGNVNIKKDLIVEGKIITKLGNIDVINSRIITAGKINSPSCC